MFREQSFKVLARAGLWVLLAAAVAVYIWTAFYHDFNVDEQEHLYASYLIFNGNVPYRDFFEHHHPLLWYLFAPFLTFWKNSADVLYVMRIIMLAVTGGTAYFIFKSSLLLGMERRSAVISPIIWLCFPVVQATGCEFRPDNLMMMFFMAGMAFFLQYLKEKRRGALQVSFVLFFLSLLCLQKVVFLFVPLGAVCLWLLLRREILWQDFAWAAVWPLGLAGVLAAMMFFAGFLKDYWELNWLLNLKININAEVGAQYYDVLMVGAVLAFGILFTKAAQAVKLVCFIYLATAAQILVHRPWFVQYLLIYYPFLAIIFAYAISGVWRWRYSFVLLFMVAGGIVFQAYQERQVHQDLAFKLSSIKKLYQFVLENTSEDDVVIGDLGIFTGDLRRSALGYYWFSLGQMASLDAQYFKRRELPDLNLIMKTRRPKMIANGYWRECEKGKMYLGNLDCPFWDAIDKKYLDENYHFTGFAFVRKD